MRSVWNMSRTVGSSRISWCNFVVQLERQIGLRCFGVEPDAGAGGNVLGYLSTPYRIL